MEDNEKYKKINLQAVMDAILPIFRPNVKVAVMQRLNGIFIFTDTFRIETDSLIGLSLVLYGTHNRLDVSSFCYYDELGDDKFNICVEGSIYSLLPKYFDGQSLARKKTFVLKHGQVSK